MPTKPDQTRPILTEPQREAIVALLSSRSLHQAAEKCGTHRTTISKWLREDKHFRAEYIRASGEAFDEGLAQMRAANKESIQFFRRLLRGKDKRLALEAAREILMGSFDADLALRAKRADANDGETRVREDSGDEPAG